MRNVLQWWAAGRRYLEGAHDTSLIYGLCRKCVRSESCLAFAGWWAEICGSVLGYDFSLFFWVEVRGEYRLIFGSWWNEISVQVSEHVFSLLIFFRKGDGSKFSDGVRYLDSSQDMFFPSFLYWFWGEVSEWRLSQKSRLMGLIIKISTKGPTHLEVFFLWLWCALIYIMGFWIAICFKKPSY